MALSRERTAVLARTWASALTYAAVVAVTVAAAAIGVGIATGGGFVCGKRLVFFAGWILIGYATVKLWPRSMADLDGPTMSARGTRFERIAWGIPPVRWIRRPAPTVRLRVGSKVFIAGIMTLGISLLMELAFGI